MHVYPQSDVANLLDAAARHFRASANHVGATKWCGVLFLTEIAGINWFEHVAEARDGLNYGRWHIKSVPTDPLSLKAYSSNESLQIVAGRQIVTSERIEVHALGMRNPLADGMKLSVTVNAVQTAQALPVLPWGVGKWLGKRGRLIAALLSSKGTELLVSDNSGRPWFWRDTQLARTRASGRPVLRGSDPLPLRSEERRVGEFGCWFDGIQNGSADDLITKIRGIPAKDIYGFGNNESMHRFFRNQLLLRLRN